MKYLEEITYNTSLQFEDTFTNIRFNIDGPFIVYQDMNSTEEHRVTFENKIQMDKYIAEMMQIFSDARDRLKTNL